MSATALTAEHELLEQVARWSEHASWRDLTAEVLRQVADRKGTDFATALLYDRLVRSSEHGPFIAGVQSESAACHGRIDSQTTVVVVPGACYVEYPQTGADGQRVLECAAGHGFTCERLPLASFGSLAENASLICEWLAKQVERPIVLVSLSKGGADIRTALARTEAGWAFRNVQAWINVSGILHGTALAGYFLRHSVRRLLARALCWYHRMRFAVLEELDRVDNGPLSAPVNLPSHMRVVHVLAFPLVRHLGRRGRRGYRRLASLGPNDGGGILLGDVTRLPGLVYPVWGTDHYLQPSWDVRPLIGRLLQTMYSRVHW